MKSPVLELQDLSSSGSSDIQDVLLKAKMISVKLGLNDLSEWIEQETNGYFDIKSIPKYRIVSNANVMVQDPFHGWINFDLSNIPDEKLYETLTTTHIRDSASVLQQYAKSSGAIYLKLPHVMTRFIHQGSNCAGLQIAWMLNPVIMLRIINITKSKILDWSLELEKKGIFGEGLLFSQKDKESAPATVNNITNIHGNIENSGVIGSGNSDIIQKNTIHLGNFNLLKKKLKSIGASDYDIIELTKIITNSPKPETQDHLGSEIGHWIGKMVGKAYSGDLIISGSTAFAFIVNAIYVYYGIIN